MTAQLLRVKTRRLGRGDVATEFQEVRERSPELHFQQEAPPQPLPAGWRQAEHLGVDWHLPVVALRRAEVLQLVADA